MSDFQLTIYSGTDGIVPDNDNVDVRVALQDGQAFSLTFFTTQNLKALLERYRDTGEGASGLYVWAKDMVVVELLSEEVIRTVVSDLVRTSEIESAGTRID